MTDPVTNVEIEDVLSSIRRLVSEKARPDARVAVVAAAVPITAQVSPIEKLVLTPALRVAEPAPESDASNPGPDEIRAKLAASTNNQVSEPLVLDTLVDDHPSRIERQAQDDQSAIAPQEKIEEQSEPEDSGVQVLDDTATKAELEQHAPEEQPVDVPEDSVNEGVSIALEVGVAEVDIALQQGPETTPPQPEIKENSFTPEAVDEKTEDPKRQPGHLSSALESRIAGWEAVVANADDAYEPATAGEDEYAGTEVESLPWQDHSDPVSEHQGRSRGDHQDADAVPENQVVEELVVEAVAAKVTGNVQSFSDETLIDEDALRDLVGEIVRQELQGALGERITRNVRKLVRREIHRALSASGLD